MNEQEQPTNPETPNIDPESVKPLPTPPRKDMSTITVVGNVYYQQGPEQPTSVESRYSFTVNTEEQPYQRIRLKVTEEWRPMESGWVQPQQCSLMLLQNLGGGPFSTNPTEEEAKEEAERVVEIGFMAPVTVDRNRDMHSPKLPKQIPTALFQILPGTDCRISPTDLSVLYLRCRKGETKINLTLYPE
jgi:hypothetical protein